MSLKLKPPSRAWSVRLLPLSATVTGFDDSVAGSTPAFSSVFRIAACRPLAKSRRVAESAFETLPTRISSPLRPESDAVENVTVYVLPLSVTLRCR